MSCAILYDKLSWYEKLAVNVARSAPVPRHMAFIMDGSRRFAKKNKIDKLAGIAVGFERFVQVMEWSLLLGIKEITLYAFSIENFKRSQSEVDFILNRMETTFELFKNNLDFYLREGVRFNVFGDTSLLSTTLQVLISKVMLATNECSVIQINIALPYTSRDEMCNTIKSIVQGVENDAIGADDIDELFFTRCLYTRNSPEVDLILRTSGETRLSDFLLWQSTSSKLLFIKTFWPEITLCKVIYQLFSYQRSILRDQQTFKVVNKCIPIDMYNYDRFCRVQPFFDKLTMQKEQQLILMLHLIK